MRRVCRSAACGSIGTRRNGKQTAKLLEALPGLKEHGEEVRETVKDERVRQQIKKYLKSGVMESGVKMQRWKDVCRKERGDRYRRMCINALEQEYEKRSVPEGFARMVANSRSSYWFTVETGAAKRGIINERLVRAGFFERSPAYEPIQSACIGRAMYRTVRTVR